MKKKILSLFTLGMLTASSIMADLNSYGIPEYIQNGNILHCFDWTFADIKAELPAIKDAGFGAVQVSPVQGNANTNAEWFYAYMPYDFAVKGNGNGNAQQLKDLCAEASKYGIKIIVDVVANHVNSASAYVDPWWAGEGRQRNEGGINYNSRYSITHGNLGDYKDVVSENSEVQARAKAFVEELKSLGVKGIRWDAAKHIGLPSEDCAFWEVVTSVPDMYHYGEILDGPGGDKFNLLREYTKYMSVTDTEYSNECFSGDGIPTNYGKWALNNVSDKRMVYWGESHDTYSNDNGYTKNVAQAKIDRTWAIGACRKNATALYFSRPSATARTQIKMGQKGSTHFKDKEIAEVNKFRNRMIGREEYFVKGSGVAAVTRQDGGAVIVRAGGAGSISVENGGGYCPAGTYTDRVSGNTFTVTAGTITGTVGTSGIAVIYNDNVEALAEPNPNEGIDTEVKPITTPAELYVIGTLDGAAAWGDTPGTGAKMTKNGDIFTISKLHLNVASATEAFFRFSANISADWSGMTEQYGPTTGNIAITPGGEAKPFGAYPGDNCFTVAPGTYDITVDFSTLKVSLTGESEEIVKPELPEITTLYLMGNTVKNGGWNANTGEAMTYSGGKFTIENVTITDANAGSGYFSFAQQLSSGTDWDENGGINDGYRFGPATKDFSTTTGTYEITAYVPKQNASSCTSWMIPAGTYNFTVDLTAMTLTVAKGVGGGDDNPGTGGEESELADLYIIGNLPIGSWVPSKGYLADKEGEYYVFRNITITNGNAGNGYFSFCRQLSPGSAWDGAGNLNDADRFGPASKDLPISSGTMEAPVTTFKRNVNSSACTSWMIAAGTYDFVLNKDVDKLSVYVGGTAPSFASGITDLTEAPLYSITTVAGDINIEGLSGQNVVIAGLDGRVYYNNWTNGAVNVHVGHGIFIVNIEGNAIKLLVK